MPIAPVRAPGELCARFVALLPVTGASISVSDAAGGHSTIGISDGVAAAIEQLQFELGEGPHWTALDSGLPVAVPDVRTADHSRWPVFGAAIGSLDVGSVFALPIVMGAVTVGVVDLYRSTPGELAWNDLAAGLSLASAISGQALREAIESARDDARYETTLAPALRREIHNATGMILVQLDVSPTEAFARLQAFAFANGRTLQSIARDVVARRLDFRAMKD